MKHTRHSHHVSYATTAGERLYSSFLSPLLVIVFLFLFLKFFYFPVGTLEDIDFSHLFAAASFTLLRLIIAYALAVFCAIPLALLAVSNKFAEKFFLPMFDILESVPILAFFPILIVFFVQIDFASGAAVLIIFLSMLWNIVFTVIGGLKIIPKDIIYASKVYGIKRWNYLRQIILPSIFPEIVTGSILAFAQGWNLVIVAEVIHTYLPGGSPNQDLFGIGSILVYATVHGETALFVAALGVMVAVIAFLNYFVWQGLIHYSERFKFE
jgi:NitT/TauT family transport system permease protein